MPPNTTTSEFKRILVEQIFSPQQGHSAKILACRIKMKNVWEDAPHSGTDFWDSKDLWGCVLQVWPAKCTLFFVKLWPRVVGEKCTLLLRNQPFGWKENFKYSGFSGGRHVQWGSFRSFFFQSFVPSPLPPARVWFLTLRQRFLPLS